MTTKLKAITVVIIATWFPNVVHIAVANLICFQLINIFATAFPEQNLLYFLLGQTSKARQLP